MRQCSMVVEPWPELEEAPMVEVPEPARVRPAYRGTPTFADALNVPEGDHGAEVARQKPHMKWVPGADHRPRTGGRDARGSNAQPEDSAIERSTGPSCGENMDADATACAMENRHVEVPPDGPGRRAEPETPDALHRSSEVPDPRIVRCAT